MYVWRALPGRADARPGAFLALPVLEEAGISVAFSTRTGGIRGPLNLSLLAGDDPGRVLADRARVLEAIGAPPDAWTSAQQVHAARVVYADDRIRGSGAFDAGTTVRETDGLWTDRAGVALAVLAADCVPVVLADVRRRRVAVLHAGWRGMVGGILERGVHAMGGASIAFVGPSIGPCCFEVGEDVASEATAAFGGHVLARSGTGIHLDLWLSARSSLARAGVRDVWAAGLCTRCEPHRFFSHRAGSDGRQGTVAMIR